MSLEHRKYLLSLPKKNVWVYGYNTDTGELTAVRPLTLQQARRFKRENPTSGLEVCEVDRGGIIFAAKKRRPDLFYRNRQRE